MNTPAVLLPWHTPHMWVCHLLRCHRTPTQSPEQQLQSGKFYFKDGSTYEGQYKLLGLVPAAADAAPAKKGVKKKEEEAPAQPAEPPKPVRHGAGDWPTRPAS